MKPEQIQELRNSHYNATLVWLREANPDLRIMRIQPDFPIPEHKPGQYTTLGLGDWEPRVPGCQEELVPPEKKSKVIRRAYSISSPILDDHGQLIDRSQVDWLEFYIVLVRSTGRLEEPPELTPRLFMLGEGDRLFLGPKITGHFTAAAVKPEDTVIFLSTGTGEAPHNYMTWELLGNEHRGKILAACCVRYKQDLGYLQVQQELMQRFPNYKYLWVSTRDPDVKKKVYIQDLLLSGRLEDELGQALDPERTHVFLCGNPSMIGVPKVDRKSGRREYPSPRGVIEILEERGFHIDEPARKITGNIHFEEYW